MTKHFKREQETALKLMGDAYDKRLAEAQSQQKTSDERTNKLYQQIAHEYINQNAANHQANLAGSGRAQQTGMGMQGAGDGHDQGQQQRLHPERQANHPVGADEANKHKRDEDLADDLPEDHEAMDTALAYFFAGADQPRQVRLGLKFLSRIGGEDLAEDLELIHEMMVASGSTPAAEVQARRAIKVHRTVNPAH